MIVCLKNEFRIAGLCLLGLHLLSGAVRPLAAAPPFPVYAYEFGEVSPERQAQLTADYHYAGTVFDAPVDMEERLRALDKHHLQMLALWVVAEAGQSSVQFQDGLAEAIASLRGRPTAIWLAVNKSGKSCAESQAIAAVRHVADLAGAQGLRVALYPHYGFCLPRFNDVLRIARAADRSNVGVVFNLCHELRAGWDGQWTFPAEAAPYLDAVTINGAEARPNLQAKDWHDFIEPLGSGAFNTGQLLQTLYGIGFRGPVAVQSYSLKNPQNFLPASYQAWTEMHVP